MKIRHAIYTDKKSATVAFSIGLVYKPGDALHLQFYFWKSSLIVFFNQYEGK